jgi:hypothetical protein
MEGGIASLQASRPTGMGEDAYYNVHYKIKIAK